MTTRPFTQHYDPGDVFVSTLVGQIGHLGLLCLIVMEHLYPAQIKAARLAFMFKIKDVRKTLEPVLSDLYTYGYASHTGSANWIITDAGRTAVTHLIASTAASTLALPSVSQPALPIIVDNSPVSVDKTAGENLRLTRSSSSGSDRSDQIQIDQKIEEESGAEKISEIIPETDRRSAVEEWCRQTSVTGDKRQRILDDSFCTVDRLAAWLTEMERRGDSGEIKFRTKAGPLNYAITCCLNHDEPPVLQGAPAGQGVVSEAPPAGYTTILNDPVFDRIVLHLAQHYGDLFQTINPRLVATDEKPNRFIVLVDTERPELKALIAQLAAGFSRKTYTVTLVTEWASLTPAKKEPTYASTALRQSHPAAGQTHRAGAHSTGVGAAFDALKRRAGARAQ